MIDKTLTVKYICNKNISNALPLRWKSLFDVLTYNKKKDKFLVWP